MTTKLFIRGHADHVDDNDDPPTTIRALAAYYGGTATIDGIDATLEFTSDDAARKYLRATFENDDIEDELDEFKVK